MDIEIFKLIIVYVLIVKKFLIFKYCPVLHHTFAKKSIIVHPIIEKEKDNSFPIGQN